MLGLIIGFVVGTLYEIMYGISKGESIIVTMVVASWAQTVIKKK